MVEYQIINKILQTSSVDILIRNRLNSTHFLVEGLKIDFIFNHFRTYHAVPDVVTFLTEFPDFELFETNENDEYMVKKLLEAGLYTKLVTVIKQSEEQIREDSYVALEQLSSKIEDLKKQTMDNFRMGYDIIANGVDRLNEYKRRTEMRGMLGIPTGIDELDIITHGWLPGEELVVIFARTNEGKSWLLLFFLVSAWVCGKKVLLYSGEMGEHMVGFRFDTLYRNFNNLGLMAGSAQLGDLQNDAVGGRNVADYARHIEETRTKQKFIVMTPKDFGGRKPTVDEIKHYAKLYEADIIGVDQISLMNDQRKAKEKRERYTNISEDLYLMSEEIGKPVLAVAQASREAVKGKKKETDTPELHEIGESDGVAQNSSRAMSLKVVNKVLRISLKKNRYGKNNIDILMLWETNLGIFKPMLEGEGTEQVADEFGF